MNKHRIQFVGAAFTYDERHCKSGWNCQLIHYQNHDNSDTLPRCRKKQVKPTSLGNINKILALKRVGNSKLGEKDEETVYIFSG